MKNNLLILRNNTGNVTVVAIMSSIATLLAIAGIFVAGKSLVTAQYLSNEDQARIATEIMFSRLAQAVANVGILCAREEQRCYWNENIDPEQFGFVDVTEEDGAIFVKADVCIPALGSNSDTNADGLNLEGNCEDILMSAKIEFADFQKILDKGLINAEMAAGDYDHYGLVGLTEISYIGAGQRTQIYTRVSVIRRPRAFIKIETSAGFCTTGCAPPIGNNPAPPCRSDPVFTGDEETQLGKVNVRIINDGPGFVYNLAVQRMFTPRAPFDQNHQPDIKLYSAAMLKALGFEGVGPGEVFEFSDTLPCFNDTIVVNNVVPFGGTAGVEVKVSAHTNKSGDAVYGFYTTDEDGMPVIDGADAVDPNNLLTMSADSSIVPASLTTVTNVTVADPIICSGMACGGGDVNRDRGADGGCDGGGDGDGM